MTLLRPAQLCLEQFFAKLVRGCVVCIHLSTGMPWDVFPLCCLAGVWRQVEHSLLEAACLQVMHQHQGRPPS